MHLAEARLPDVGNEPELRAWTDWMAKSGARVTMIGVSGQVLADSANSASDAEKPADWPEVQQALANGTGRSVDSVRELVCRAQRFQAPFGSPFVIRLALPLAQIDL